jgi:hypothetical protein
MLFFIDESLVVGAENIEKITTDQYYQINDSQNVNRGFLYALRG